MTCFVCGKLAWANNQHGGVCARHDPVELRDHPPHKWLDGKIVPDEDELAKRLAEFEAA